MIDRQISGLSGYTYLVPKTRPQPIAHISTPAFINNQSSKLILKLLRRKLLRIVILKRATRVLSGRWYGTGSSRRGGHHGRRNRGEREESCRRLSWRGTRCRTGIIGIFPTQMLDDALEATQARKQLGIGRTLRLARGPARWGENAVNTGLDTIRARRTLIAADLPATTSYTAPRAGYIRGRAGGGGGHARARTWRILTGGGGVQPLRRGRVE